MLTEKQRHGFLLHADFCIIEGPKHIGYVYGGGGDWLDVSMEGMTKRFAAGEKWTPDCSRLANWCMKWAGWKPIGGFGHEASSGEAYEALPHFTDVRKAMLGTIIVWGIDGEAHWTQVIGNEGSMNPTLLSHGGPFQTNKTTFQIEHAYRTQLGQSYTCLAVGGL